MVCSKAVWSESVSQNSCAQPLVFVDAHYHEDILRIKYFYGILYAVKQA